MSGTPQSQNCDQIQRIEEKVYFDYNEITKVIQESKDLCTNQSINYAAGLLTLNGKDINLFQEKSVISEIKNANLLKIFNDINNTPETDKENCIKKLIVVICQLLLELWKYCISANDKRNWDLNINYNYKQPLSLTSKVSETLQIYNNTYQLNSDDNILLRQLSVDDKQRAFFIDNVYQLLNTIFNNTLHSTENAITNQSFREIFINTLKQDQYCDIYNELYYSDFENKTKPALGVSDPGVYEYFCLVFGTPSGQGFGEPPNNNSSLLKLYRDDVMEPFEIDVAKELNIVKPTLIKELNYFRNTQFNPLVESDKNKEKYKLYDKKNSPTRESILKAFNDLTRWLTPEVDKYPKFDMLQDNLTEYAIAKDIDINKYTGDDFGKIYEQIAVDTGLTLTSDDKPKLVKVIRETLRIKLNFIKEELLGDIRIYIKIGGNSRKLTNLSQIANICVGKIAPVQTTSSGGGNKKRKRIGDDINKRKKKKRGGEGDEKYDTKSLNLLLPSDENGIRSSLKPIPKADGTVEEGYSDLITIKTEKNSICLTKKNNKYSELFLNNETNSEMYNNNLKQLFAGMDEIDNRNINIFGYGYSGSGKTYTLIGNSPDFDGLLFQIFKDDNFMKKIETIQISDILENSFDYKKRITFTKKNNRDTIFEIVGLSKDVFDKRTEFDNVYSNTESESLQSKIQDKIQEILSKIEKIRIEKGTIKYTPNNPMSSRSHLLFRIKCVFKNKNTGYITLIDMGGAENSKKILDNITDVSTSKYNNTYTPASIIHYIDNDAFNSDSQILRNKKTLLSDIKKPSFANKLFALYRLKDNFIDKIKHSDESKIYKTKFYKLDEVPKKDGHRQIDTNDIVDELIKQMIYTKRLMEEGFFINATIEVIKAIYKNNEKDKFEENGIQSILNKVKSDSFIFKDNTRLEKNLKFIEFLTTFTDIGKRNENDTRTDYDINHKFVMFGNIREDKDKEEDSYETLKFLSELSDLTDDVSQAPCNQCISGSSTTAANPAAVTQATQSSPPPAAAAAAIPAAVTPAAAQLRPSSAGITRPITGNPTSSSRISSEQLIKQKAETEAQATINRQNQGSQLQTGNLQPTPKIVPRPLRPLSAQSVAAESVKPIKLLPKISTFTAGANSEGKHTYIDLTSLNSIDNDDVLRDLEYNLMSNLKKIMPSLIIYQHPGAEGSNVTWNIGLNPITIEKRIDASSIFYKRYLELDSKKVKILYQPYYDEFNKHRPVIIDKNPVIKKEDYINITPQKEKDLKNKIDQIVNDRIKKLPKEKIPIFEELLNNLDLTTEDLQRIGFPD